MDEDREALKKMAQEMMLAKKGPPDLLNTVHIKDEECGEVSRAFALRWKDELYEV